MSAVGLVVDARGKRCPLPVIMLARLAAGQPPGTVIEVLADDPAAAADIPAWCRMRGHTFVSTTGGTHIVELASRAVP